MPQTDRYENESFAAYKVRRAASNAEVRAYQRDLNHGAVGSRQKYRDEMRRSGAMGKRIRASDALMAAWAGKRVPNWKGMTDKHGAKTVTGRTPVHDDSGVLIGSQRRIWLAGISEQRGY